MGDLQTDELHSLGIVPGLIKYFDRYSARTGVRVHFEYDNIPEILPDQISIATFRIIQEALTNVVRHAGVSEVEVKLRADGVLLYLEINDHGRGFNIREKDRSFGLSGMRDRASLLGGRLKIDSTPGNGTHIGVCIPLGHG